MKRVYLDNCCYNRPYDNQNQLRIFLEGQAKMEIQRMIRDGELELVTSYWTDIENADNPFLFRKENIAHFQQSYASVYIGKGVDQQVNTLAKEIEQSGIKHKDACHAACAIIAKCDYLLTTDDRFLKMKDDRIRVMNPTQFIYEIEEDNHHEHC